MTTPDELAVARSAARTYGELHGLSHLDEVDGPPVLGPVRLERDGRPVVAFRWLGSGRGGDYVQVELDVETGRTVVYGARGDEALPEWRPESEERETGGC